VALHHDVSWTLFDWAISLCLLQQVIRVNELQIVTVIHSPQQLHVIATLNATKTISPPTAGEVIHVKIPPVSLLNRN